MNLPLLVQDLLLGAALFVFVVLAILVVVAVLWFILKITDEIKKLLAPVKNTISWVGLAMVALVAFYCFGRGVREFYQAVRPLDASDVPATLRE